MLGTAQDTGQSANTTDGLRTFALRFAKRRNRVPSRDQLKSCGIPGRLSGDRDCAGRDRAAEGRGEDSAVREQYTAELALKNQELAARNQEVEKANRLKSEFLASMSHELRTPLHTVIGFSELLLEEIEGPVNAKQKRFLGHIKQDSQHLLELINDILDLSKIEAGRLELRREEFDVIGAVDEVLASVRLAAEEKSLS